ncbi:MAG: TlpA family protein disulfide reductase [Gammaproteobacteria bacterium]|nr:TlpA family protein disulfide reductase [Gammaproteobacteria bacterium]
MPEPASAADEPEVRQLTNRYLADGFYLKDLDGDLRRLEDFRGRVVLLNFWATWCPPCREEMPSMQQLYQDRTDEGLTVVAVSVDRGSPEEVRAYVEELELTFPVLHDRDNRVSDRYRIPGVPVSYLVDRRGRIAYKVLGSIDWSRESAIHAIEGLLEEAQ